jgi:hypothetical protein
MATPGRGHKSWLQYGIESSYGVTAVATHKVEIISMKIDPIIGVIRDPSLYDGVARRAIYQGGLMYKGSFTIRATYAGIGMLWKHALGAASVSAGPPYTHTFKESAALQSLTLQMIEGDVPTGHYMAVTGAIITGFTIRGSAGQGNDGMLTVEFEILAKNKADVTGSPTSITNFPALNPVLFHQATLVDLGAGDVAFVPPSTGPDVRVRSFEITHRSSYAEDRFYLGSTTIDQPLRSDFISCQWKITSEFQSVEQFTYAAAFTAGDPEIIFTQSSNAILRLVSNSANLVEYSNPVENYGIILAQATWESWYDATDLTSLMITNTNTQTTAIIAN